MALEGTMKWDTSLSTASSISKAAGQQHLDCWHMSAQSAYGRIQVRGRVRPDMVVMMAFGEVISACFRATGPVSEQSGAPRC